MIYITKDDLITNSYERFIDESSKDVTSTLDKNEARAIAIVKSYISGRYDVNSIFASLVLPDETGDPEGLDEPEYTPSIRHELLVEIIAKITLYKVFRRNAARKVPEDVKEDYEWAIKELAGVRNGSIPLIGLPPAVDESGQPISKTIWGNNTQTDYYI